MQALVLNGKAAPEETANAVKLNEHKGTKSWEEAARKTQKNTEDQLRKSDCPIDVFPADLQKLISELNAKSGFPIDFCVVAILFCFSIAIGNNYRAVVKKSWREPAVLYLCVIAPPGCKKTPVFNFFLAIFRMIENNLFNEWLDKVAVWEQQKQTATKDNPFTEERPVRKQFIIQDATQEAAVKFLYNNPRGGGSFNDEMSGFICNINRHTNGGDNTSFYLSTYNSVPYSKNRSSDSKSDVYIASPYLSICGGTQESTAKEMFSGNLSTNGMTDRILYANPKGLRKEMPTDEEVDQRLTDAYNNAIRWVINEGDEKCNALKVEYNALPDSEKDKTDKNDTYVCVGFDQKGKEALYSYFEITTNEVNEANDKGDERIAGIITKFDYHIIRLSLILQIISDSYQKKSTENICEEAVKNASKLCNYFKQQAKRVYGLIKGDPLAEYTETERVVYRLLNDDFSTADAIAAARQVRASEDVKDEAVVKWAERFIKCDLFIRQGHGKYSKKQF